MKSKISFFNKTLYANCLVRNWPLWVLATIMLLTIPFSNFMEGVAGRYSFIEVDSVSICLSICSTAVPIIVFIYAPICAFTVWNYLFNARSIGMMHSLPIRRSGLFVTNVLSGMTMLMIPFVACAFFQGIVFAVFGKFTLLGVFYLLAFPLLEGLLFFALATLAAGITGSLFAMPVFYLIINFIAPVSELIVQSYASRFRYGVRNNYLGVTEFLSPFLSMMKKVLVSKVTYIDDSQEYAYAVVGKPGIIIGYGVAGLVILAIAYLLYRNRKSETAGNLAAAAFLRPVILVIGTALATGIGGMLFYTIYDMGSDDFFEFIPIIICMLLAGTIGYYVVRILLDHTYKVVNKKNVTGLLICYVCILIFVFCFRFDILGSEKKSPSKNDVAYITAYSSVVGSGTLTVYPEDELYDLLVDLHKSLIFEKDYYIDRLKSRDDYEGWTYLEISYVLKNGKNINRYYRIPMSREKTSAEGTAENKLAALANKNELKLRRFGFGKNEELFWAYIEGGTNNADNLTKTEVNAIKEAIKQDILAGNIPDYDFFGDNETIPYKIHVEIETKEKEKNGTEVYLYGGFSIYPKMQHTIKALLDNGLINEASLVLADEPRFEEFGIGYDHGTYYEY